MRSSSLFIAPFAAILAASFACGSGGTAVSTCGTLSTCCGSLSGVLAESCNATASQSGITEAQCGQALTAFQTSGECGGAGSGSGSTTGAATGSVTGSTTTSGGSTTSGSGPCTTLAGCCPTLPAAEQPSECMDVVQNGTASACTATLSEYQAAGYCGGVVVDSGAPSSCDGALAIVFSPMYSAIIPGDTTHTFQVPASVTGVSPGELTWAASSNAVSVLADPSTGGVLLTMSSSATSPGSPVTITARAGTVCGSSVLNVTVGTTSEWSTGAARFNDGLGSDAGARVACSECHGAAATSGVPFKDVAASPEQIGGFSDAELLAVIQNGQIPAGGVFDTSILPLAEFQKLHQYGLTASEQTGIVLYLRSLTPSAQNGTANFGGH